MNILKLSLLIIFTYISFSYSITLEEAIIEAINNNPELKAKAKDLNIVELDKKISQNLFFPEIFVNFSYTKLKDDVYTVIPPNQYVPFSMQFKQYQQNFKEFETGLNYLLFSSFQRINRIKLSEKLFKTKNLELNQIKRKIIGDVIESYINVLIAKSMVKVWYKELKAVKAHLRRTEEFFKKGYGTKVEILQTKVRLSEVKRELRKAKGNLNIALANLNRLLGRDINEKLTVHNLHLNIPAELNQKSLEEKALQNREELKILRKQMEQLNLSADIYKADFLPKFFLQAKYFYTDKYPSTEPNSNFAVSVFMNVKFQGQIPYLKYKQEKEKVNQLRLMSKNVKEGIKLEIKTLYENYKTALDNLEQSRGGKKYIRPS